MAIKGLIGASVTEFQGKNTLDNLASGAPSAMLSAKNVLVLSDKQVRRMPGYALLAATGLGAVRSGFNFERSVDQRQFILGHIGDKLVAMNADGSGLQVLSTGETSKPFQFVSSAINAYASNGVNAYRFVDVGGVLKMYQWGIAAPGSAPSVAVSAGTLSLTYGRRYVRSFVSKYTDSIGVQRVHVGAPSPYSAHTGPVTNGVVTLGNLTSSSDPQVTHQWIFATVDSPIDTDSTYLFAAEITISTTTWADTLLDSSLDDTRLAPFDNNPAPPSAMLSTFQNRIWATQLNQIRLSGYAEIEVGIPQEAWPLDLFFNIPAGARLATGQTPTSNGAQFLVGTEEAWFDYTGYDASTFTEADNVARPGPAGPLAVVITPYGIVWLSISRQLFVSTFAQGSVPRELSAAVSQQLLGTLGMESISYPATARLHWYSYGRQQFLVCIASTTADANNLDWVQVWSVDTTGESLALYQTDKFPQDLVSASFPFELNGIPFIATGDAKGNLYTFPNGFSDNGVPYQSTFSTAWTQLGFDGVKRFYFVDFTLETTLSIESLGNAAQTMKVFALVVDAPLSRSILPISIDLQVLPVQVGQTGLVIRGNLQAEGLAWGRFIRIWVELPDVVNEDQVLQKMTIWYAKRYNGVA